MGSMGLCNPRLVFGKFYRFWYKGRIESVTSDKQTQFVQFIQICIKYVNIYIYKYPAVLVLFLFVSVINYPIGSIGMVYLPTFTLKIYQMQV